MVVVMEQQSPPSGRGSPAQTQACTRGRSVHTRTSPSAVWNGMGSDAQDAHARLSASWNQRAACERRVPEAGLMYSPLPRSGSWSSQWAGRRCCGKARWVWRRRRRCCWAARLRPHSSGLWAQRRRLRSLACFQVHLQPLTFRPKRPDCTWPEERQELQRFTFDLLSPSSPAGALPPLSEAHFGLKIG